MAHYLGHRPHGRPHLRAPLLVGRLTPLAPSAADQADTLRELLDEAEQRPTS